MSSVDQQSAAGQVEQTELARQARRADNFRNQRNLLIDVIDDLWMVLEAAPPLGGHYDRLWREREFAGTLDRCRAYRRAAEHWRRQDP